MDVEVKSITVNKANIVCLVNFPKQKFSDKNIKDALLKIRPTLKEHKCKNSSSKNFEDILAETSLAHIMEHLIIDMQIECATKLGIFDQTILGISQWVDKDLGAAKIKVDYFDDVVAIKCINEAAKLLSNI